MIEETQLRNFAPKTIDLYVDNVAKFAKHFGKKPEILGDNDVRHYLVHLVEERKLACGMYNQALAALRKLRMIPIVVNQGGYWCLAHAHFGSMRGNRGNGRFEYPVRVLIKRVTGDHHEMPGAPHVCEKSA
jgi:hypothetical protein